MSRNEDEGFGGYFRKFRPIINPRRLGDEEDDLVSALQEFVTDITGGAGRIVDVQVHRVGPFGRSMRGHGILSDALGLGTESPTEFLPTPPTKLLFDDLMRAHTGDMPLLKQQGTLELFGLDGETPDGKTMPERFAGTNAMTGFRWAIRAQPLVDNLVTCAKGQTDLGAPKEQMLANVGALCDRQIVREGNICPTAHDYALQIGQARPKLLSGPARTFLGLPNTDKSTT